MDSHHIGSLKVIDPWNQDIPTGRNMSTIWQRSSQYLFHRYKSKDKCSRYKRICQKPNLKHHQFSTQTICSRRRLFKMLCLNHRDQQAQWQESSVASLLHFQKICAEIQQHISQMERWKDGRKSKSLRHLFTAHNLLLFSGPRISTKEEPRNSRDRYKRETMAQSRCW